MSGIDLRRFFASEPDDEGSRARAGTPVNYREFPTDIVLLVVMWRLRDKLSLRDLAEMFLERGFEFTHEAVGEWEARFAPLVADTLHAAAQVKVLVTSRAARHLAGEHAFPVLPLALPDPNALPEPAALAQVAAVFKEASTWP